MRKAAVIGKPISHSLSPAIFGFLSRDGGKDFSYEAIEISPENLAAFIDEVRADPAFIGLNVTIPHKEAISKHLSRLSPQARTVGAVNVVEKRGDELIGHNTDVAGVTTTFTNHRVDLQDRAVLLIGAGGAARAAAYAAGESAAKEVIILNQSKTRAIQLVEDLQAAFPQTKFMTTTCWEDLEQLHFSAIVQSTPLGMPSHPFTSEGVSADVFFSGLRKLNYDRETFAFDMIYRPRLTPFLRQAATLGMRTAGGLEMLSAQALETWRLWFRDEPQGDVYRYLSERPVFLTGFMGCGKSTIGRSLAGLLQWNFIETDKVIESKARMSIPEIFSTGGENLFRKLEAEVIREAAFQPRTIVALGGGALGLEENRKLLKTAGVLVYLAVSHEQLNQRLKNTSGSRPLLAGLNVAEREKKIASLLKEREPFYNEAILRIETGSLSVERAAHKIQQALSEHSL